MVEQLTKIDSGNKNDEEDTEGVHVTNVPTIPLDNQADQITKTLSDEVEWPNIADSPIDEFRTSGYIACAFPTLFPFGNADLRQGRIQKVGDADYFKFLMMHHDGRFAKHPRFPFFAMNSTLRWSALNQGKVFVKQSMAGKSLEDLRQMLSSDKSLSNKIMYYGATIRGTKAYWFKRCGELLAMVEQIGTPSIFFTLSAADLHWPDLFRLLKPGFEDDATLSEGERIKLMCENPMIVATFFEKRGTFFIEHVLKKKFKVTDIWYRFEWQHRGSPHIHGLLWIDGAPSVDNLESKSKDYQEGVIQYFDQIVSTWNPDKSLAPGNVHPCRIKLKDVANDEQSRKEDYTRLLNKVQRHTVCSESYCLRKMKSNGKMECRFKFPIKERESSELEMESTMRLYTKRNDDRLNIHNPFVSTLWRANTDFQPIISRQAVVNYIAKYASKSEPQSEGYKELLGDIIDRGTESDSARKAVQKLLMKTVAERDYSAQEVVHILMGYPLYHSSREFVTLNTKTDNWVHLARNQGEGESIFQKYQGRPNEYANESLYEFCGKFYKKGKKWVERKKRAVVLVFPKLKINDEMTPTQKQEYYRQKVLLYTKWRSETDIIKKYNSWEDAFKINNIQDLMVEAIIEDPEENEYEEIEEMEEQEVDEYMVAAADCPNRCIQEVELGRREIDLNYDWSIAYNQYDCGIIPTFLSDAKRDDGEIEKEYPNPDVVLTKEQAEVMKLLHSQIAFLKGGSTEGGVQQVKRVIVQGKGGSGKSTVIKAMTAELYSVLQKSVNDGYFGITIF